MLTTKLVTGSIHDFYNNVFYKFEHWAQVDNFSNLFLKLVLAFLKLDLTIQHYTNLKLYLQHFIFLVTQ